ncbi:MAG: protoporphyrinogen oxidase [Planctomycetes bacterium]|nr:protoporphyrinogen oxidase [Planctomycetota bacterium]
MQARIAVVGGGISGLAAAWAAVERAQEVGLPRPDVTVFEAGDAPGGKARSLRRDGWLVEAGPTGFLDNEPVLDELVQRARLAKLPADEAAARRFLVRDGILREIHANPLRFAGSGILSPAGLLRVARERWVPRRTDPADESIWAFAERRLGRQAAERLIAPMVLGVFAGDARKLSLPAAFPRMAELEATYGSLFRAMGALRRERKHAARPTGGPSGPAGALTSFAHGLEELPRALAERGPFEVRCHARVEALDHDGDRWRLRATGDAEALPFDAVVLAGEAWHMAPLCAAAAPSVADELAALTAPGLAVVALGYGPADLARTPRGFGALIQREEGFRILGVLWDTHLFPERSPADHVLVRCMIGGATDPEGARLSEDELVRTAAADLARLLGYSATPVFHEVVRWERAIPQYELGHLARVARIDAALATLRDARPGLHLGGNARTGVAFGKAARQGWDAGRAAVEELAALAPAR